MRLNKELANSILSEVHGDQKFFCVNSEVFKTLEDLQQSLKKMDENTFLYHVNSERNDFSAWINDVLGDVRLAENLSDIHDRKEFAKKIRARITYIKKYC